MPEIREVLSTDATVMDAVVAVIGSSIFIHEILQSVGCKDIKQSEHDFVHARGHVHMTSAQGGRGLPKNMETIYWTCGGVANIVNIIIVRLNSMD